MGTILTSVVAFVVAISLLIAIHEYGHYIVARLFGIKVLRYSIGFGKPLWSIRRGADDTEYCISALPLGGYVKLLDGRETEIAPEDQGRAFDQKPVPQRIAVLFAGPAFNFLFAIAAYWILFVQGVAVVAPVVGEVEPGSYAAEAGLAYEDRILQVGGKDVSGWEDTLITLLGDMVDDGRVRLTVERADGSTERLTIDVGRDAARLTEPGVLFDGLGFRPWSPPVVVGEVNPDSAAEAAGLESGDRIEAVDGEPVASWRELTEALSPRPGETVAITYRRDGDTRTVETTLGEMESDGERRGILGISNRIEPSERRISIQEYGPLEAVAEATGKMVDTTVFTVRMLFRMVVGDVSLKNISGPVNIAQYAGSSASAGSEYFIGFLAVVSISLGVLNLLPIPMLDGGQIVYQTVEWIKGTPLSERAQMIGQQVGILALIAIMGLAFYNDLTRIFAP
ncbi:RIP metalloprotease RseP [Lentisalinibacter salinarum]|uniref:RIP metalloprotease RseP n=1 Tax=Lentisalinibacter salinarum TaxID=2992239 RepID=UPI00386B88AC